MGRGALLVRTDKINGSALGGYVNCVELHFFRTKVPSVNTSYNDTAFTFPATSQYPYPSSFHDCEARQLAITRIRRSFKHEKIGEPVILPTIATA